MKVEYSEDRKTAYFDGYKFRRDAKTGYYLANKPTYMGHRERLHVYVWRKHNGPIPAGYHVHHVDEDKSNNDIENLRCIPQKQHMEHHSREYAERAHDAICRNLIENVRPKASEWHKSEAGRAWHSKQAKINAALMAEKEFVCQYCGKHFFKKPLGENKFCSNNCKSAWRRKSGVDNETRICANCGKEFRCNKYSTIKYCSRECATQFRYHRRDQASGQRAGL